MRDRGYREAIAAAGERCDELVGCMAWKPTGLPAGSLVFSLAMVRCVEELET